MVLDCKVLEGNPGDSTLAIDMISRHGEILGEVTEEVVFDGGFASQANVRGVKNLGVRDVAFSKRCGLSVSEMVRNTWVHKRLRNFRAGIEGVISLRTFIRPRGTWGVPDRVAIHAAVRTVKENQIISAAGIRRYF